MKRRNQIATVVLTSLLLISARLTFGQQADRPEGAAPIYRVTVVERTASAVNYQYRSGPTRIDFRGTVLLPHAKGGATVESRQGRTEIDAKIEGLAATKRFGSEYLTYVLWAITPQGRPHNIGELIADSSDRAKLRVTTDLQAFALIVTAEPYSAVRQPSDVVVAENQVRPDTVGTIKPVEAKYELLPRGQYTWHVAGDVPSGIANAPKVSVHQYEAVTELYQAQSAVDIARNAGAERYAPDTFAQATQLLANAQQLRDRRGDFRRVVQNAREAAQTAEDARVIAYQRRQTDQLSAANAELSKTQAELSNAQQAKQQALDEARQAQAQADAARIQADAAAAASKQAESESIADRERAARAQFLAEQAQLQARASNAKTVEDKQELDLARKRGLRLRLLEEMKGTLPVLDTGRGLVATVSDDGFHDAAIRDVSSHHLARIASILSKHPGLHVSVEGYSANATGRALSRERADAVRRVLIAEGMSLASVSAAGLGETRPLGPNTTLRGQKENTRVEIVVAGDSIGDLALWQQTSSLTGTAQDSSRH